jgi:UDP-N-acetylglucosamine 4,6-dehydratase
MNKKYFKNKTILITGGTGSFGQAFVNYILRNNFSFRKIIIY